LGICYAATKRGLLCCLYATDTAQKRRVTEYTARTTVSNHAMVVPEGLTTGAPDEVLTSSATEHDGVRISQVEGAPNPKGSSV